MPIPRRHGSAPARRAVLRAEVVRTTRLSPHFLRVTVAGDDLSGFGHQGLDQNFRLFLRADGQDELVLPTVGHAGWMAQYVAIPARRRPLMRGYTVRAFRPAERELDIDFVLHEGGPAARWAAAAVPGEPVGIIDEGTLYRVRADAGLQLVVADETGVPAALAILEQTPPGLRSIAFLEVPTAADVLPAPESADLTVTWLPRDDPAQVPGVLAAAAVRAARLPEGSAAAFLAGESALVTGLRRHLVAERGWAKGDITFFGYWKHGRAHG